MSYLRYLYLLAYSGIQHISCFLFVYLCFVSCVWCCPTHIVFLVCLSVLCVLCMVLSNTYRVSCLFICVVCLVYGVVHHILCFVFVLFVLRLVYPMLPVSLDCPSCNFPFGVL